STQSAVAVGQICWGKCGCLVTVNGKRCYSLEYGFRCRLNGNGLCLCNCSAAVVGICPCLSQLTAALVIRSCNNSGNRSGNQTSTQSAVAVGHICWDKSCCRVSGNDERSYSLEYGFRCRLNGNGLGLCNCSAAVVGICPCLSQIGRASCRESVHNSGDPAGNQTTTQTADVVGQIGGDMCGCQVTVNDNRCSIDE